MIVVYGVKEQWSVCTIPRWGMGILLLIVPVALSWVSLIIAGKLSTDSLPDCGESTLADNEFLPVYLGYFFVALSVPDNLTMLFLYIIVFIFTYLSQTQYFNPLYLLFGYHYYHVVTNQGTHVFIIARRDVIRNRKDISFAQLKRINNTTYLAIKGDNRK